VFPLSEVCLEISRPYGSDLFESFPHNSLFCWRLVCVWCEYDEVNSDDVVIQWSCIHSPIDWTWQWYSGCFC